MKGVHKRLMSIYKRADKVQRRLIKSNKTGTNKNYFEVRRSMENLQKQMDDCIIKTEKLQNLDIYGEFQKISSSKDFKNENNDLSSEKQSYNGEADGSLRVPYANQEEFMHSAEILVVTPSSGSVRAVVLPRIMKEIVPVDNSDISSVFSQLSSRDARKIRKLSKAGWVLVSVSQSGLLIFQRTSRRPSFLVEFIKFSCGAALFSATIYAGLVIYTAYIAI